MLRVSDWPGEALFADDAHDLCYHLGLRPRCHKAAYAFGNVLRELIKLFPIKLGCIPFACSFWKF